MKRISIAFALIAGVALVSPDVDAAPRTYIPQPHAAVPVTQPTYGRPVVVVPAQPYRAVHSRKNALERRQAELDRRIDQGARSGALTRSETKKLREKSERIDRKIRMAFRDDRRIDNGELARIDRAQDKLERDIRFEKRDRQARG